jgi:RHS repeat-associated protein
MTFIIKTSCITTFVFFSFSTTPVLSENINNQQDQSYVETTTNKTPDASSPSDGSATSKDIDSSNISKVGTMTLAGGAVASGNSTSQLTMTNSMYTGAATTSIPIEVPPGRGGIAPNLALTYVSQRGNGKAGVGWDVDMGAIQRSTKFGVDYNASDFVGILNGSSTELIARSEWGSNFYGAKVEGAFLKYYRNPTTGGWEVTAKNGTKYYYGSTSSSRQENGSNVFKWCLDKVQDLNGNYMTISYWKDQGEIYIDRIDYTGNNSLSPSNYVKLHYLTRYDSPDMYVANFNIKTLYRIITIEVRTKVGSDWVMDRAYGLDYGDYSSSTFRSRLSEIQVYGNDAQLDAYGRIISGSPLPPINLDYYTPQNIVFDQGAWISGAYGAWQTSANRIRNADVNGDGKADVVIGPDTYGNWNVMLSSGNGFVNQGAWISGKYAAWYAAMDRVWNADVNGDGKADVVIGPDAYGKWYVMLSTGSGFVDQGPWISGVYAAWATASNRIRIADVNGDGMADVVIGPDAYGKWYVMLSTGSGFVDQGAWISGVYSAWYAAMDRVRNTDVNGDGRADVVLGPDATGNWNVMISTGHSFVDKGAWIRGIYATWATAANRIRNADVNGDGKADVVLGPDANGNWNVMLSTGNGFIDQGAWINRAYSTWSEAADRIRNVDVNGDGKSDIMMGPDAYGKWYVMLSTGYSFIDRGTWISGAYAGWANATDRIRNADVNGDGKEDVVLGPDANGNWYVLAPEELPTDYVNTVFNGFGGNTSIGYVSSTKFLNTRLPFPVQIVQDITADDNNSVISQMHYTYLGGIFDPIERDFRGFGYIMQTNPNNTLVETWFHQDNVYKGLVDHQIVEDSAGNIYTFAQNTYQSVSPYNSYVFPFLQQADEYLYDGTQYYRNVRSWFEYDSYGNMTRKYNYGDTAIAGDERYDRIDYTYDTNNWIVSLPSRTYVMDGAGITKEQTWFTYYSGTGKVHTKTSWLENGGNPVTSYIYDPYGNIQTITDPRNYSTNFSYDATYTYPTIITDQQMGFYSSKTYDLRYGKPLTETDLNGNATIYQYDVFGRQSRLVNPYDVTSQEGTQSAYYENFGLGAGYQRVATHSTEQSGTANYIWKENYFDGFGRTIKTRSEGPDGKIIVTDTEYDTMGRVLRSSLPYFENMESPRWVSYAYDPVGRVAMITNPDDTHVTKSYALGTTVSVDANGHKKEADRDPYGRLAEVREYTGTSPNFSLYATTRYQYDVLGNLLSVTDTAGNVTSIGYDTLSRKRWMTDPDMGHWTYDYDANGNLVSQTDAKYQTITFGYDALNRLLWKHYPTGPDVTYAYDEPFSTNPIGRLTTINDLSGRMQFYYDKLGRTTRTVKTVDSVDYTTDSTYDALGRTASVTYPDPGRETVSYSYDTGGNLSAVGSYATYTSYNALGQAGGIAFGNGASTSYQYYPLNSRLYSITTNSQGQGRQNLSYTYDNAGNVQTITDLLDSTRTQSFVYDDLNRISLAQSASYGTITYAIDPIGNITNNSQVGTYTYTPGKPHAVQQAGVYAFSYDANGNMTQRLGGPLTYDYENRLSSMTNGGSTTSFVYDTSGGRVKKINGSVVTVYIGNLYECTSGVCSKHIFAGGNRIVTKYPTATYYYHTDHLRSSSVITDGSGAKVEEIYYYPFGQSRFNSGGVNLKYKYTGQEEDAETGLYYYGARYYDPVIGRFTSPDILVPNPIDPQDLNRYTYAGNNPLLYTDPTGHFKLKDFLKAVITGFVGAVAFIASGGTDAPLIAGMIAGMSAGATGAAINGGGLPEIVQGAVIGGALGGIGGGIYSGFASAGYGAAAGWGMVAAGAGYATATGGLDGLAYFAGGIFGGVIGYGGANYIKSNWIGEPAIGGMGNCNRCMSEDVAPSGQIRQLDYRTLFEGDERITSQYGTRKIGGVLEFHGGIDVAPQPNTGFGTELLAPSNGQVFRVTSAGIYFRPEGFSNGSLLFYHVSLAPNLASTPLPINVQAGSQLGTLANVGRIFGAHVHIQLESGGHLYNPSFVFP